MSLAGSGRADHAIVRNGVEFLLRWVRPDGSWPLTPNLAIGNTSLATRALAAAGEDLSELGCLGWILDRQHNGGWSWTDEPDAVPDVDNTAGALLALAAWPKAALPPAEASRIEAAASGGVQWLLKIQNDDGGWPTLCRGRGTLAYDRSGCEPTASALRALCGWRTALVRISNHAVEVRRQLDITIGGAVERGLGHLAARQHPDGYWMPLWFGDQDRADEANPVRATCQVLAAYRDLGRLNDPAAARALEWLLTMKHGDGSWGGGAPGQALARRASVEETALAVDALTTCGRAPAHQAAAAHGLEWLISAVESNRHQECSPIGRSIGRVGYYEKLYPLAWTVSALGRHVRRPVAQVEAPAVVHSVRP